MIPMIANVNEKPNAYAKLITIAFLVVLAEAPIYDMKVGNKTALQGLIKDASPPPRAIRIDTGSAIRGHFLCSYRIASIQVSISAAVFTPVSSYLMEPSFPKNTIWGVYAAPNLELRL